MDNAAETVNITESTARDPRAAWLPESMTMKIINMNEAIKNYCAAVSDKMAELYPEAAQEEATYTRRRKDK
jgi:hypothetical protein